MKTLRMRPIDNEKLQFPIGLLAIVLTATVAYPFSEAIGYRSVALLLLLTVSLLSLRMSLYPVMLAATASALIWNFFFIPPQFTFQISNMEDALLFFMYFIVALLNGVFSARIRRAEEQVRKKEERAKAAKLYDTLFNSLSHELRTPIASIMGASDNLLTNPRLSDEVKQALYTEIGCSSDRLNRLVDNLLNMSRLDSGYIQPKLDWCDLEELLQTTTHRLRDELKDHPTSLDLQPDLPLVKLDFGLMETALTNLVYNAACYSPKGSAICIAARFAHQHCVIEVADHGPGFQKGEPDLVFEKFYRSKNSRTGGLGLGLSIAKGFVEAHGGTIHLQNKPGGGALFTLKIPSEAMDVKTLSHE